MPDDKKWKPDLKMARFRAERVHPEPYQRSTSFDPKTLGRAEDVMARHLDPRVPLPTTLNLPPVVRCRCGHLGNDAEHEDIGGRCLVPGSSLHRARCGPVLLTRLELSYRPGVQLPDSE